jgi:hypothetical protein
MRSGIRRTLGLGGFVAVIGGGYLGVVQGAVTLDFGIGRRERPLGPLRRQVRAPRQRVFDLIASPYLQRTPRALEEKLHVIERGSDMVLAAHFTPIGRRLRATTIETVRFERPHRVSFRLLRGPVPEVVESFTLEEANGETGLEYRGTVATDLWALGDRWGRVVARRWEDAVTRTLDSVQAEAQRPHHAS